MTTIAYKGGIVAADRMITSNGKVCGFLKKIHITEDRGGFIRLIAVAGRLKDMQQIIYNKNLFNFIIEDFRTLVLEKLKTTNELEFLILSGNKGDDNVMISTVTDLSVSDDIYGAERDTPIFNGMVSLGSGESEALAAMMSGKTAIEAVQIASKIDCYTGGGVDYYDFNTGESGFIE